MKSSFGVAAVAVWLCLAAGGAGAAGKNAFELDMLKTRFEHEIAFREAAIHVAWGAEALCDDTTEIEPFVLWSANSVRRGMGSSERELLRQATGMDEKWRIAWLDESAPDELKIGDVVVAINDRPLPANSLRIDMAALFRGRTPLPSDDQGYWELLLKAREEALENKPMSITLEGGRRYKVDTQAGCAGSVFASAFDDEPDVFWRQGNRRAKIPGNALLEAINRDEYRWLAAFGTYFQATERAIGRQQVAEDVNNAFVVGQVLSIALPGSGMVLSAMQARTIRIITVDGLPSSADLFANEVVTALGGDPAAGLKLNLRIQANKLPVDELQMTEFRRVNTQLHIERLLEFRAAKQRADAEASLRDPSAQLPDEPAAAAGSAAAAAK